MTSPAGRQLTPWLLALAGYTALTLIVTWPLALRLSTVVPHDAGDPIFTTWILWWNAHIVPLDRTVVGRADVLADERRDGAVRAHARSQPRRDAAAVARRRTDHRLQHPLHPVVSAVRARRACARLYADRTPRCRGGCRPGLRVQPLPHVAAGAPAHPVVVLDAAGVDGAAPLRARRRPSVAGRYSAPRGSARRCRTDIFSSFFRCSSACGRCGSSPRRAICAGSARSRRRGASPRSRCCRSSCRTSVFTGSCRSSAGSTRSPDSAPTCPHSRIRRHSRSHRWC